MWFVDGSLALIRCQPGLVSDHTDAGYSVLVWGGGGDYEGLSEVDWWYYRGHETGCMTWDLRLTHPHSSVLRSCGQWQWVEEMKIITKSDLITRQIDGLQLSGQFLLDQEICTELKETNKIFNHIFLASNDILAGFSSLSRWCFITLYHNMLKIYFGW